MSITRTENEAKCFDTTGSACLDFFSKVGGMRGENVSFISGLSSSIFQHMEELIALPAYDAMIKILEHYSCYFD